MTDEPSAPIAVRGLHIRRYKNLRDVFVPWADGVAIFGVNGAGKTNLLECLTLLFGTARTLGLASDRMSPPGQDNIAVDVRVDQDELPLSPDEAFRIADGVDQKATDLFPGLARPSADADWWRALGASEGASFLDGVATSMLPADLVELLQLVAARPVIRYTLEEVDLAADTSRTVPRRFRRTLLTPEMPTWLPTLAPALPDEFGPLRSALAAGDEGSCGWWPLVALPGNDGPPIEMEWLSRARSSNEAAEDFADQFQLATPPAEVIASCLQDLKVAESDGTDPSWLLHLMAVDAANEDLSATLPYLQARPVGEAPADIAFDDTRAGGMVERARTTTAAFLEPFSSGERRWLDEALATAARVLADTSDRWEWQSRTLETMDEDLLLEDLLSVSDAVAEEVRANGWFTAEAMRLLLSKIEGKLLAEMRRRLLEQDYLERVIDESMNPDVRSLRPRLTMRVFDEPEAHLHPSAQRQIAAALERLRLRGNSVVVTTHSPHFLALPRWQLVHAQLTDDGSTFSRLTPADLDARKALAGQLGLTRGELLTQVSYILVVEGEADRLVLDAFFGQRLRDAGVAVLRMHGTNNLLATADLDFVQTYLDTPVGVLLDYTRLDVVNSSKATKDLETEEQQLRHLRQACRSRGRRIDEYALTRPDIVAYLDADIIRETNGDFAGWSSVLKRYQGLGRRESFKPWLLREFGVDLVGLVTLRAFVSRMQDRGVQPPEELEEAVRKIERTAGGGSWALTAPLPTGPEEHPG